MTNFNLQLSPTLISTLTAGGKQGTYFYALGFYTDNNGNAQALAPLTVVLNGQTQSGTGGWTGSSGSYQYALPTTFKSGKIYLLEQSVGPGEGNPSNNPATGGPNPPPLSLLDYIGYIGGSPNQATINWNSALSANYNFRYDSVEMTMLGASGTGDVANLTSVNSYGLPMELTTAYTDGRPAASTGYSNAASGVGMWASFYGLAHPAGTSVVYDFGSHPLTASNGEAVHRAGVGPSTAVVSGFPNSPYNYLDWDPYVSTFKTGTPISGTNLVSTGIKIAGFFSGAPDANNIYHTAAFFSYAFDYQASTGLFWLLPEANSQVQGAVSFGAGDLDNSIYAQLGLATVSTSFGGPAYTNPLESLNPMVIGGPNNQWTAMIKQLLVGFTGGYWGTTGGHINPQTFGMQVNLNQNWNWDPSYAFGQNLYSGSAQPVFYDHYEQIFFNNSNSYGSPYADALMSGFSTGGPLLPIYDFKTQTDVSNLNLTIFDDYEAPYTSALPPGGNPPVTTPPPGYTRPTVNNYGPPAAQYTSSTYAAVNPASVGFSGVNTMKLVFANAGMVMKDITQAVTLSIDVPVPVPIGQSPLPQGNFIWQNFSFTPTGTLNTFWQNWTFTNSGSSLSLGSAANAGQPQGTLLIANLPVPQSNFGWYRIHVAAPGVPEKLFNVYLNVDSYIILDPLLIPGALSVDGGALIQGKTNYQSLPPTSPYDSPFAGISFLYNTVTAIDPSLLTAITDSSQITTANGYIRPWGAVVGTLSGSTFTSNATQGKHNSILSTTPGFTSEFTTTGNTLAFGWTGLNPAATTGGTTQWVAGPTNQMHANYDIVLVINDLTTPGLSTTQVLVADIDGHWQSTSSVTFNVGDQVELYFWESAPGIGVDGLTSFETDFTVGASSLMEAGLAASGDGVDHYGGSGAAEAYDGAGAIAFADYSTSTTGLTASLPHPDTNTGDAAGDSYSGLKGLIGTHFDDTLQLGNADGSLWAIYGNDTLKGGAGNDDLHGQDGNDVLNGGAGSDLLDGGSGDDVFAFARGQAGGDTVADFGAGADSLQFTGYGTAAEGATFTQVDATHWMVNSADGQAHETITFANGASVQPTSVLFI